MRFDAIDFRSIIVDFFENVILRRGSDKRRLIHISNREFADRYRTHSCLGILKNKPQIKQNNRKLFRQISVFICVYLRLIFVSLSDRSREIQLELFSIQEKIEPANSLIKSPQRAQSSSIPVTTYDKAAASRIRTRMTRVARIFTDIFDHHASLFPISDNKPQRSQRTQSIIGKPCTLGVFCGVLTLFAVWLTRIYTYPRASASSVQSVFYCPPPVLIGVHPRLIFAEAS